MAARLISERRREATWLAAGTACVLAIAVVTAASVASLAAPAIPGADPFARAVIVLLIGAGAVAFLGLGLAFEASVALVWAAALLAAAWLAAIWGAVGPGAAVATPIAVGAVLAVSEIAHWSLDLRPGGAAEPAVHRARALAVTGLCLAATAVAFVPAAASLLGTLGGADLAALAAAVVVAAVSAAAAIAGWHRARPARALPARDEEA